MLELRTDLQAEFAGDSAFDRLLRLEGKVYRHVAGRRTVRFELAGRSYFLKAHAGVGWREIVKNLLQGRLPVLGAANEKEAIEALQRLGIETMSIAGYGVRGINPARRQSLLITDELTDTVSLEDFCRPWPNTPPPYRLRKILIDKVADVARQLHSHGVNHRDFYLCHFLLQLPLPAEVRRPADLRTYLIDLHRVQVRVKAPRRWLVKDVAGLYFSSLDIGLSRRDALRFVRRYSGMPLRRALHENGRFWRQVCQRAVRLYERDFGRTPRLPLG